MPPSPGEAINAAARVAARDRNAIGSIKVLTNTKGPFALYVNDLVDKVRKSWYRFIPADAQNKRGKLAIEFAIRKDGSVGAIKIVESSGDETLDRAALEGIKAAGPFSELPNVTSGRYVLLFRFYYNGV